ncbi:hypothetical protein IAT38_007187 [Cryptococcus sp. DSM 104549]
MPALAPLSQGPVIGQVMYSVASDLDHYQPTEHAYKISVTLTSSKSKFAQNYLAHFLQEAIKRSALYKMVDVHLATGEYPVSRETMLECIAEAVQELTARSAFDGFIVGGYSSKGSLRRGHGRDEHAPKVSLFDELDIEERVDEDIGRGRVWEQMVDDRCGRLAMAKEVGDGAKRAEWVIAEETAGTTKKQKTRGSGGGWWSPGSSLTELSSKMMGGWKGSMVRA